MGFGSKGVVLGFGFGFGFGSGFGDSGWRRGRGRFRVGGTKEGWEWNGKERVEREGKDMVDVGKVNRSLC